MHYQGFFFLIPQREVSNLEEIFMKVWQDNIDALVKILEAVKGNNGSIIKNLAPKQHND